MKELEAKFVAPKNGINDEATDANGPEQQDLTLVVADESENEIAQFDAKPEETHSSTHNDNNAQPSPSKKSEGRVYERGFLITLRDVPSGRIKPTKPSLDDAVEYQSVIRGLKNLTFKDVNLDRHNFPESDKFRPIPRGLLGPERGVQEGRPRSYRCNIVLQYHPLRKDFELRRTENEIIKLRETKHPWRPGGVKLGDSGKKATATTAFFNRVRGILNKIMPGKVHKLGNQVKALNIHSQEQLQDVVDLLFEKAVDESKFVVAYARMCKKLRELKAIPPSSRAFEKLPISRCLMEFDIALDEDARLNGLWDSGTLADQGVTRPNYSAVCALMCKELAKMQVSGPVTKTGEEKSNVNFRKLIITRCQMEFEKNIVDKKAIATIIKEIKDCPDPDDKKEQLLHTLNEEEKKIQVRCVGNIRFIGELFRQRLLVTNIVHRCIRHLLTQIDEGSLECLCKLLSRIGKALESKGQSLDGYFIQILDIVNRKGPGKVSLRARFMLQDVVELRLKKWVPRRALLPFKKKHSRSYRNTILYKLPSFPRQKARA